MSDPLGLIGQAGAAGRLGGGAPLLPRTPLGGAGGDPVDPSQPSFKDALLANLNKVNQLQQEATTAIEDISAGRRDDLEGVLLATQKADLAFKTLLSVRNKVHDAFEEMKQMRV